MYARVGVSVFKRLTAAVAALLLVGSMSVFAQSSPSGSGISVSPTISEFTLKPGQANTLTITLKNITVDNIIAQAIVNDFASDNVTGNPKIITDPNKQSPNSIKNFVIGLENTPLRKGEQKKINIAIQAPDNVAPGAYFGVLRFKAVPANQPALSAGEVALTASVGTIVLITVPGNVREQVQLAGIHIYNNQHEGVFFFKKPTDIGVEIRNLGNGFAKPFGTVEIQKMFGGSVYNYQINNLNPRSNVLPSSSRIFRDPVKNISQPGRYTVLATVSYGSGSQVLTLSKTFWYVPGWLLGIILLIILIMLAAAFRVYRRHLRNQKRFHRF